MKAIKSISNCNQQNFRELKLNITDFQEDVYVGIDKILLKEKISTCEVRKIAEELNLNRNTVANWYLKKEHAIKIANIKKICKLLEINPKIFNVRWIGGKGRLSNRIVPWLDSDLAYFIGLIVGDGHLYENRVVISGEEQFIKEITVPYCKKIFPDYKIIARDMKDCFWCELNSRPLVWFLRDVFEIPIGKKTFSIKIPSIILNRGKPISYSFLKGLFDSDGSIGKKGEISFSSASKQLVEDVEKILKEINIIFFRKIDKRGNPVYHIRFGNSHSIRIFSKFIGFNHPRKNLRLSYFCPSL